LLEFDFRFELLAIIIKLFFFPGRKKKTWIYQYAYRLVIGNAVHRARVVHAITKHTKFDIMKAFGVPSKKIQVIYEGVDSFRRVLNDVLWSGEKELLILWPFSKMRELIGVSYMQSFTTRRLAKGIRLRSIWARDRGSYIEKPELCDEEVRIAPRDHNVAMGYLIYGNKVAFISSKGESYSFAVSSGDFSELERMQFEKVWDVSQAIV